MRPPRIDAPEPGERFAARVAETWACDTPDRFLDAFCALMRDDAVMNQSSMAGTSSKPEFRRFFRRLFTLMPDARSRVNDWACNGNVVFLEMHLTGTLGGRPFELRACDRVVLDGEMLAEREAVIDLLPLMVAIATRPRAWPSAIRAGLIPRLRDRRLPAALASLADDEMDSIARPS